MKVFFTICSNNYLAQANILGASLKNHNPEAKFFVFLCDELNAAIDYHLPADEIIPLATIEPRIHELAVKYDIVELNTALKPKVIEYLFTERKASVVIYLDPDIKIFSSLTGLYKDLEDASILLTPHIHSPIPIDGKKPSENTFLKYGVYNLGFIGLRNDEEAIKFVNWWKNHTYTQGYRDNANGIFVDQLPVNLAPIFFKNVKILSDPGLNMAPWNLHERYLTEETGKYAVNKIHPLKFYHFSSFITGIPELPQQHYNRFQLKNRPDLQNIYEAYNEELKAAGHTFYQQFTSAYSVLREFHFKKVKKTNWLVKWLPKIWLLRK